MAVLGASGSGKSTLLRVLAGLDPVESGRVFIKGRDVTAMPPGRRRASMVFEAPALIPFLDVSHNLGWALRLKRVPPVEVEARVTGRARQFRLSRLLSRRPAELSGGERGLVGVGHALVQAPDVFLLDEPLAGLDAHERVEVRRQIVEIVRSLGVTTFYVTHDQAEALAVADRIALLDGGELVQVGPPRELYERPGHLRTATSIGSPPMGLLPARLVVAGGQAAFEVGARTLPLWRPVPSPLRGWVGREVVLGFRAEDVRNAAAGADPDAVVLDGLVTAVEFNGRQTVVTATIDALRAGGAELFVDLPSGSVLRAYFGPDVAVHPGSGARLGVEAVRAHVFDPVTGQALWHPGETGDGSAAERPG